MEPHCKISSGTKVKARSLKASAQAATDPLPRSARIAQLRSRRATAYRLRSQVRAAIENLESMVAIYSIDISLIDADLALLEAAPSMDPTP